MITGFTPVFFFVVFVLLLFQSYSQTDLHLPLNCEVSRTLILESNGIFIFIRKKMTVLDMKV